METANLVTFTKKKYLANGKLHFLFSVGSFVRKQNHTLNFHESGRTFSGITHMAKITYRYSPKLLTQLLSPFSKIFSAWMFDSVLNMTLDVDPAVKKDKPLMSFQEICKINRKENAESLKVIALTERNSGIKVT